MSTPKPTFDGAPIPASSGDVTAIAASFVGHIREQVQRGALHPDNAVYCVAGHFYETYCMAVGGVARNGDKLPEWPTFCADPAKAKQVRAWMLVAKEALK